jgi:hypothetical protein
MHTCHELLFRISGESIRMQEFLPSFRMKTPSCGTVAEGTWDFKDAMRAKPGLLWQGGGNAGPVCTMLASHNCKLIPVSMHGGRAFHLICYALTVCWLALLGTTAADRHVSVGGLHVCAIDGDSLGISCSGDNTMNQLAAPAGPFHGVSAGSNFTCGLRTNGTMVCWGALPAITQGLVGELFVAAVGGIQMEFLDISAGARHVCGLTYNGTVICFGDNTAGACAVPLVSSGFQSISSGSNFTCGVTRAYSAICWGGSNNPVTRGDLPRGNNVSYVASGARHACAIYTNGTLGCWGDNAFGQTSFGNATDRYSWVTTGTYSTCAIRLGSGTVDCWGSFSVAAQTPGMAATVAELSCGVFICCAVSVADASTTCWSSISSAVIGSVSLRELQIVSNLLTTITTMAGGGAMWVDGTGTSAYFFYPASLDVDTAGNVYVADTYNHRIRVITPGGVTSTLAGTMPGYADGGTATAAFNYPRGVRVAASGVVYVADTNNHRIRKISVGGNVSTFAGNGVAAYVDGVGTIASFNGPGDLAVDASGTVYVADVWNHRIRKVTVGGNVSTVAGSGSCAYADGVGTSASFCNPYSVAVDTSGNLYVDDYSNHRIRKVAPNGVVSTLAGSGAGTFADGTGTAASFAWPRGVAVDGSGNVFVADLINNRIRKVTPAGVVTTFAGGGASAHVDGVGTLASFYSPVGVAVDASGNVYVADCDNHRIRKITTGRGVSTLAGDGALAKDALATSATFLGSYGVAADTAGNVYVADTGTNRIRKITAVGSVSTLAGNSNATFVEAVGTSASFKSPTTLALDAIGNVYVADQGNHRIRKIAVGGAVTTLAGSTPAFGDGTGTSASFSSPTGVAIDNVGNVYVTDSGNNRIRKVTQGGVVTTLAGTGANGFADAVGTLASFDGPYGIAVDSFGNAYVGDYANHRIRKVDPGRSVTTFAGNGNPAFLDGVGTNASFYYPTGVCIDNSGNMYVADTSNQRIRKISPGGIVITLNGIGGTFYPAYTRAIGVDAFGTVYAANSDSGLIFKLSPVYEHDNTSSYSAARKFLSAADTCTTWRITSLAPSVQAYELHVLSLLNVSFAAAVAPNLTLGLNSAITQIVIQAATPSQTSQLGILAGNVTTSVSLLTSVALQNVFSIGAISGAPHATLQYVDIQSNGSLVLNSKSFEHLPALRAINSRQVGVANFSGLGVLSHPSYYDASGTVLDVAALCSLSTNMRVLDLGSNRIVNATMSVDCMACGPSIILRSNVIASVADVGLARLFGQACASDLDLSFNNISKIDSSGFELYAGLAHLSLIGNPLALIAENTFTSGKHPKLSAINVSGTPLDVSGSCPPGYFNVLVLLIGGARVVECSQCPTGQFCPGNGARYNCAEGTYSNGGILMAAQSSCQNCPIGTFNSFSGSTRQGCISCAAGTASNISGAVSETACRACPPGRFAVVPGMAYCSPCPAGSYSDAIGSADLSSCTLCPLNTYSYVLAATDASTCSPCPAGSRTASTGASSSLMCVAESASVSLLNASSRGAVFPVAMTTDVSMAPPSMYLVDPPIRVTASGAVRVTCTAAAASNAYCPPAFTQPQWTPTYGVPFMTTLLFTRTVTALAVLSGRTSQAFAYSDVNISTTLDFDGLAVVTHLGCSLNISIQCVDGMGSRAATNETYFVQSADIAAAWAASAGTGIPSTLSLSGSPLSNVTIPTFQLFFDTASMERLDINSLQANEVLQCIAVVLEAEASWVASLGADTQVGRVATGTCSMFSVDNITRVVNVTCNHMQLPGTVRLAHTYVLQAECTYVATSDRVRLAPVPLRIINVTAAPVKLSQLLPASGAAEVLIEGYTSIWLDAALVVTEVEDGSQPFSVGSSSCRLQFAYSSTAQLTLVSDATASVLSDGTLYPTLLLAQLQGPPGAFGELELVCFLWDSAHVIAGTPTLPFRLAPFDVSFADGVDTVIATYPSSVFSTDEAYYPIVSGASPITVISAAHDSVACTLSVASWACPPFGWRGLYGVGFVAAAGIVPQLTGSVTSTNESLSTSVRQCVNNLV